MVGLIELLSWLTPPASDDFHGLVQRLENKFKDSNTAKALNSLKKAYVRDYTQYEKDSTTARNEFAEAGKDLAKDLGIEVSRAEKLAGITPASKISNKLAEDSGIEHGNANLSYNQALGIYSNPKGYDANFSEEG